MAEVVVVEQKQVLGPPGSVRGCYDGEVPGGHGAVGLPAVAASASHLRGIPPRIYRAQPTLVQAGCATTATQGLRW